MISFSDTLSFSRLNTPDTEQSIANALLRRNVSGLNIENYASNVAQLIRNEIAEKNLSPKCDSMPFFFRYVKSRKELTFEAIVDETSQCHLYAECALQEDITYSDCVLFEKEWCRIDPPYSQMWVRDLDDYFLNYRVTQSDEKSRKLRADFVRQIHFVAKGLLQSLSKKAPLYICSTKKARGIPQQIRFALLRNEEFTYTDIPYPENFDAY